MLNEFQNYINGHQLLHKGQQALLAVSGGVDSVVMCELFARSGYKFGIAHCNFKLRKKASDEDEQFVKQLAERYQVPFFSQDFDTEKYASDNKISIQMAARELRYEWLEQVRKNEGFMVVATAHHKNDNVETVLMNLTKGTGIKGLQGILPRRNKIIRPLLFARKEEIENFASREKLNFREDASNLSVKYERNKIRHAAIPVFEDLNPDFITTFSENIQRFQSARAIYRQAIEEYKQKLLQRSGEEIFLPFNKLKKYPAAQTILHEILKEYHFNSEQTGQIWGSIDAGPGKMFFSGTHRLIKDRKHFIISPLKTEEITNVFIPENKKRIKISGLHLEMRVAEKSRINIKPSPKYAYLDYEKLEFPLQLRKWRKGDYFYPFGMNRKKKKLSDFFTDQKLSIIEKEKAWVLLSGKKIVWVVGYRIDERFKVAENTKKIYKLKAFSHETSF